MKINQRFTWAVAVLEPSPKDHILEIGCGNGILTEQIALQLKSGTITAIDRSIPSIKQAEKRNTKFIKAGKVKLIADDFDKANLPKKQFDKILAFNVNIFWKGSDKDFQQLRHCLKPTGQLFIFYQTPSGADPKLAKQITERLEQHDFTVIETLFEPAPTASFCIISKPT